jgi:2-amino-4-hydroxy-6-hydroxymethyldihydropteridine diphosphokinase
VKSPGGLDYWIGLGSNQGDRIARIREAIQRMGADPAMQVLRVSSLYRTAPWGDRSQPEFINAVVQLSSPLVPLAVLDRLLAMESELGRSRSGRRWGPRVIDLDVLLAGDRILHLPRLILPHPRMHRRRFVLEPLQALAPDLEIPARGRISTLLQRLPDQDVRPISATAQV